MASIDSNLNLYKTPSNEILQHRKEFYSMWKRRDDQTVSWFNLVQSHFDRCEFPQLISREYLLIDKFVCKLNDGEREFIRKSNTWTLMELKEYFVNLEESIDNLETNGTGANKSIHHEQQIPSASPASDSMVAIKCDFVSASCINSAFFFCVVMFPFCTHFPLKHFRMAMSMRKVRQIMKRQMRRALSLT